MKKLGRLRRRWILNTVGVVCTFGLICVLIITAVFSAYYYSAMESDLRYRAMNSSNYFTANLSQSYRDFYQACINYTNSFESKNNLELQFIDSTGHLIATSYGTWTGDSPATAEISEAISMRQIRPFRGRDTLTNERIIAVSSPLIYNDAVVGVLRFVTATRLVDRQIVRIVLYCCAGLLIISGAVWLSSNYYMRSILLPVAQITEKAKRIAAGSYGIQLEKVRDDEIGDLVDTINEMSIQISQNEKMQRDFISSLSHELRTPLTSITGWSETLLAEDNLNPDTRRGMRIILREGKRLTEMVVDLLDFNRIQDDRMTLNIDLADIRGEFEDTVYMYSSRLAQENIILDYEDSDEEIPEIPCDAERLRQVFLNILNNAAKHGGDGKRIVASIHMEQDEVVVRIRDFGPGIPEDELPLVKKKFYKGSSKARGTGIGLAICDEIISMHNGSLTLENADGGGTLVTVRLPATQ